MAKSSTGSAHRSTSRKKFGKSGIAPMTVHRTMRLAPRRHARRGEVGNVAAKSVHTARRALLQTRRRWNRSRSRWLDWRSGPIAYFLGTHEPVTERFTPSDDEDCHADCNENREVDNLREERFFFHGAMLNSLRRIERLASPHPRGVSRSSLRSGWWNAAGSVRACGRRYSPFLRLVRIDNSAEVLTERLSPADKDEERNDDDLDEDLHASRFLNFPRRNVDSIMGRSRLPGRAAGTLISTRGIR